MPRIVAVPNEHFPIEHPHPDQDLVCRLMPQVMQYPYIGESLGDNVAAYFHEGFMSMGSTVANFVQQGSFHGLPLGVQVITEKQTGEKMLMLVLRPGDWFWGHLNTQTSIGLDEFNHENTLLCMLWHETAGLFNSTFLLRENDGDFMAVLGPQHEGVVPPMQILIGLGQEILNRHKHWLRFNQPPVITFTHSNQELH